MAARLACPRIPAGGVGLAIQARMTRSLIGRHYSAASWGRWPRGVGDGADIAVDGTQGDLLRAVVPGPIVPDRARAGHSGAGLETAAGVSRRRGPAAGRLRPARCK